MSLLWWLKSHPVGLPEVESSKMDSRYIDLAINWLDDDDNPYGEEKMWRYING